MVLVFGIVNCGVLIFSRNIYIYSRVLLQNTEQLRFKNFDLFSCPTYSQHPNSSTIHIYYRCCSIIVINFSGCCLERYYLVRAGESEYESMGIINTNPVAKTSMDSGLSERGKEQTVKAAFELKAMGACERSCWIWPSITQRAYQAAEIIASANGVTRR